MRVLVSGDVVLVAQGSLWPAFRHDDADVLIKAGCIAGHDTFVVKIAPWFKSNEIAGQAQGGLVAAFSAMDGRPTAVLADEHYLSNVRTATSGKGARSRRPSVKSDRQSHHPTAHAFASAAATSRGLAAGWKSQDGDP